MGCGSSCLPIKTPGVVAAEGGGQADMSSLTKKPSRFSFRSPQNVNRGDCNQFTLAAAWNMARLFSIFFCFVAPTLADYAVLPEEETGPNLLTRILMDACMRVASRLRVRRCVFLFPLPSSCSMSPLQMMSLITSLTPVSLPHISPQSFTNTPLCQSLQSHLHPTPIVPKPPLQGGCILIWFFPQTATPYMSLWTHLKVIPLLISETTWRHMKAGACVCVQHDLDGRRDLPPHPPKHICSHKGALLPDRHGVIPRSPTESERCSVFDSVSVGHLLPAGRRDTFTLLTMWPHLVQVLHTICRTLLSLRSERS